MSFIEASRIANYLTTGYFADAGYGPSAFAKRSGDVFKVFPDFSRGADRGIVDIALDAWTSVTGLRFALSGTAQDHDIRLTDSDTGAYSFGYASGDGVRLSSVVNVGRDWMNAYGTQTVSYYTQTWIHEIGHALGLGHAGDYNGSASWGDRNFALDSWQMSIMSYFSPSENPNVSADDAYVLTPMPADILAMHRLYGEPATERRADIYGFDGNAEGIYGEFGALLDSGATGRPVMLTLFDAGGRDMLNLSRTDQDQRIDLRPGAFSDVLGWVGTLGIAYGTVIENARSGAGNDRMLGNEADNRLHGGGGADRLQGLKGNDILHGGGGNDRLFGQLGADTLRGGHGADWLDGGPNSDLLLGGRGNDTLAGQAGNDRLLGNSGADRLWGHAGSDTIWGGYGDDILHGGDGNDILRGGRGNDLMTGGAGEDIFVFRRGDQTSGRDLDRITDFTPGSDLLDLRRLGLDQLVTGRGDLDEGMVRAVDRNDRTHLFTDLDGDGRSDLHLVLLNNAGIGVDDLLM
ncbi:M10 family metallopeptidase [Paracoccus salsus]|uniref:M10 family metallopeptidase n=1 Tax=Paracoccus salsus TaxID=2911061 RepID=UPI001F162F03|nr:M10 family metallopeptidase C-terminal domain-containing protein [Paracoccus salsus]MCF3973427.1 M10 family metallopeptidase C-terminal domain-containing protein [Paracoccus salsus]